MEIAYQVSYPLKMAAPNGVGIIFSARMLYFPQHQVAVIPVLEPFSIGNAAFNPRKPDVLKGKEAETAYSNAVNRKDNALGQVEVDSTILAWAMLNSEIPPSRNFQRRLLAYLFPFQVPLSASAEVIKYHSGFSGGIDQLVTGISIPALPAFIEIEVTDQKPGQTSYFVTAYHGPRALQRYEEVAHLALERKTASIDMRTLDTIIDSSQASGEQSQLLLAQAVVDLSEKGFQF